MMTLEFILLTLMCAGKPVFTFLICIHYFYLNSTLLLLQHPDMNINNDFLALSPESSQQAASI